MKGKGMLTLGIVTVLLTVSGPSAMSAQDRYTLKVPDGLAFSEFRGYEDWKVIAASHQEKLKLIEVIVGNPMMIDAYKAGIPGNGKPFPDGAKMAEDPLERGTERGRTRVAVCAEHPARH